MAGVRLPFRGVVLTVVSAMGFGLIGAGSIALRAQFDAPAPSDAAGQAARTAVLPDPPPRRERRTDRAVVLEVPAAKRAPAQRPRAHAPSSPSMTAPAAAPKRATPAPGQVRPVAPARKAKRTAAAPADQVQLVDMTSGRVVASGAAVDDVPTGGTVCPLDGCP